MRLVPTLVAAVALLTACRAPPEHALPEPAPSRAPPEAARAPRASPQASPQELILAIARDIERLAPSCPQLSSFSADRDVDTSGLIISYQHHTHDPPRRGGWRGAVPEPDPDGIWLYIDLHEPGSKAQIHTQPVVPMRQVGALRLMMLIAEGEQAPRCSEKIGQILDRYGSAERPSGPTQGVHR